MNALTYLSYRARHVVGKVVNEHKSLNSLFKEVARHVEDKKGKEITLMENFHTFGGIFSPFEAFGDKDTLFEAFSTYLEANYLHEKVPCGIIEPSKERNFLMKMKVALWTYSMHSKEKGAKHHTWRSPRA